MVYPGNGRTTACDLCPLRQINVFRKFSEEELDFMRRFKTGEISVQSGALILQEGVSSNHLYTVLSGWAFRFKAGFIRVQVGSSGCCWAGPSCRQLPSTRGFSS